MAITSGYSAEDLARLGPDALTRRRMLAEALLAKSAGQRKIEHPLQGAAQMAEALINGLRVRKIDQAETAGMKSGESAWSSLFGGSSSASAPETTMPATTGAGQELGATSPAVSPSGGMDAYRNAIASIESAGSGDYAAVGPTHPRLGRALGRYQIMEANIGPWSQEALGRAVTPEEFMADPKLQDAIFDKKFGGYVEKYGPEGAAQAWIGGPGGVGKLDRKDSLGTSIGAYGQKFTRAIGGNPQVASVDPSVGLPPPAVAPQASAYVDPTVSAQGAPPPQMAALPPAGDMPPLEPPRTIGTPPVPPNAPPPQQMAQALTGNVPPPQQQGPSVQDLAKILSNPWVSDDKKKIAQVLLGEKMKENDPLRKQQLEKGQLEIDRLKNPDSDFISGRDGAIFRANKRTGTLEQVYGGKPENFRTLTDDEEAKYGLDPSKAYQIGADNKIQQIGGGGTTVNIDQKAEGAFDKKLAEKQAETFNTMADEGMNARADLSVIGELEGLLQGQGGALTGISGALAKYGIGGEGIDDLQAANALINKLVPTQRAPGSGSMSDRDVEMFRSSLPSLWNSPGGNQKIINVMKGLAQYKQAQGEIADEVLTGDMSRQEARRALRNLPNPLEEFRKNSAGAPSGQKTATPAGDPDFSKMTDEELQRYIDGK